MWGLHLKKRGRWWHYYRAVPDRCRDIDARQLICFSLRTTDFTQAKLMAAQISSDLERDWQRAIENGKLLSSHDHAERYGAAVAVQLERALKPKTASDLTDTDLVERLRLLLNQPSTPAEKKAVRWPMRQGSTRVASRWVYEFPRKFSNRLRTIILLDDFMGVCQTQ